MKRSFIAALALGAAFAFQPLQAAVSVFACEPEWAGLAEVIGGDEVSVYTATTARQDPHFVQARPSLIAKLRSADLVVCTGAGLEAGWLPLLLQKARNPRVLPGQPGYLAAADQVDKLEVPERLDRAEGDIHAEGNPHVQTSPRNLLAVARAIAQRLAALHPAQADGYTQRFEDFATAWRQAMLRWEQQGAALAGRSAVVHHREWSYLLDWLGMSEAAALEPKPGVPPSAGYLAELKDRLQRQPASLIIRSPLADERPSRWLSEQTGIAAVVLPHTLGATDDATDLFAWFDAILARLTAVSR